MKKIGLLILLLLLSSCGGEVQDCEQIRISPPDAPPYWVTICADEGGGIPVTPTLPKVVEEGEKSN